MMQLAGVFFLEHQIVSCVNRCRKIMLQRFLRLVFVLTEYHCIRPETTFCYFGQEELGIKFKILIRTSSVSSYSFNMCCISLFTSLFRNISIWKQQKYHSDASMYNNAFDATVDTINHAKQTCAVFREKLDPVFIGTYPNLWDQI